MRHDGKVPLNCFVEEGVASIVEGLEGKEGVMGCKGS
jgi:hypothetical protein